MKHCKNSIITNIDMVNEDIGYNQNWLTYYFSNWDDCLGGRKRTLWGIDVCVSGRVYVCGWRVFKWAVTWHYLTNRTVKPHEQLVYFIFFFVILSATINTWFGLTTWKLCFANFTIVSNEIFWSFNYFKIRCKI